MTKLFRFTFVFLTFSSCLLHAESKFLEEWWKGKGAAGDLFGVRPTLEDRGLDFSGHWGATFASVVAGGLQKRGTFVEQVRFELDVDFAKLTGWEALEGLTGYASTRWRDGTLINPFVGTTSLFSPVDYRSGHGWRIMPLFLTYTTPELFGIKELLTISGGWQNPYDDIFAYLPASKSGFRQNGIVANKGISANDDVDWSSSYAAWGGYLKIKPTDWFYAMAGLYMAIPGGLGTSTANHGLDFEGSPGNNGLWFLQEIGLTPKLGASKLPGKYFFGWYYWGVADPVAERYRPSRSIRLLLGGATDALARTVTPGCGGNKGGREILQVDGDRSETQAQRSRADLVCVVPLCAELYRRETILFLYRVPLQRPDSHPR